MWNTAPMVRGLPMVTVILLLLTVQPLVSPAQAAKCQWAEGVAVTSSERSLANQQAFVLSLPWPEYATSSQ